VEWIRIRLQSIQVHLPSALPRDRLFGVKASGISFQNVLGKERHGPAHAFINFFQGLKRANRTWLNPITLNLILSGYCVTHVVEDLPILRVLSEICRALPQITVEYIVRDINTKRLKASSVLCCLPLSPFGFMNRAIRLQHQIRSIDLRRL
jgi:hypothetical protein